VTLAWPVGPAFGAYIRAQLAEGRLVVQPRMGFGDPASMRAGIAATVAAGATTAATITIDSYTRTGNYVRAAESVPLNGFPLLAHPPEITASVADAARRFGVPVQVRHGSAVPQPIVSAMLRAGITATEGGPVSYCLPYGRTPLRESLRNWDEACALLAQMDGHLETFGGCMLGQLCPPGLLVALSVLEGLYFAQRGLRSISLSYAQQTNQAQDEDAVLALRALAAELLPASVEWHVVVYTYMGVFPKSPRGARLLNDRAAVLAARTGAARLIVKTVAEAHRIPTIEENVGALESAAAAVTGVQERARETGQVRAEARALVDAVLGLSDDIGVALLLAFRHGWLDLPFCPHPDNNGQARGYLDHDGILRWSHVGRMPISSVATVRPRAAMTSAELLAALRQVEREFDREEATSICRGGTNW
jgi:methylaspartate mutase epsilon subunit